ncbi:MAG TPA: COX aromatic rich motif-containing protein [Candidatus Saccharimonadales bacterium]|nr:COX aromatic rich motif-containing protein [Candidatus Saccharimonadales bacterium]
MTKRKNKLNQGWLVLIIILGLIDFGLLIRKLLHGHNVGLFNPKGRIAEQQHSLMIYVAVVMLIIAIPSVLLLYFIAWKYRESNTKATYDPDMRRSRWFDFSAWAVPTVFMLLLASAMIPASHRLQPRKLIASDAKPLTIQVISMRWKWLFIYPDQKIATINFVQLPLNTPVTFEMTADETPMSSFWIPNLGGQLYTMTSHVNRLNLIANTPGDYPGSSAELNGAGFAGMKFTARASSMENFDNWVQSVKQSPEVLDATGYQSLLKPSEYNPASFYSAVEPNLYTYVISKYEGPGGHKH